MEREEHIRLIADQEHERQIIEQQQQQVRQRETYNVRHATHQVHAEDRQRRCQDDIDEGVAIENHLRDRDEHDRRLEQDENN
jgi:hypothetical protein